MPTSHSSLEAPALAVIGILRSHLCYFVTQNDEIIPLGMIVGVRPIGTRIGFRETGAAAGMDETAFYRSIPDGSIAVAIAGSKACKFIPGEVVVTAEEVPQFIAMLSCFRAS